MSKQKYYTGRDVADFKYVKVTATSHVKYETIVAVPKDWNKDQISSIGDDLDGSDFNEVGSDWDIADIEECEATPNPDVILD